MGFIVEVITEGYERMLYQKAQKEKNLWALK